MDGRLPSWAIPPAEKKVLVNGRGSRRHRQRARPFLLRTNVSFMHSANSADDGLPHTLGMAGFCPDLHHGVLLVLIHPLKNWEVQSSTTSSLHASKKRLRPVPTFLTRLMRPDSMYAVIVFELRLNASAISGTLIHGLFGSRFSMNSCSGLM